MEPKLTDESKQRRSVAHTSVNQEWFIATALLIGYALLNNVIPTVGAQVYKWLIAQPTAETLSIFKAVMMILTPLISFGMLGYGYKKLINEAPVQWNQFKRRDILSGFLTTLLIIGSNAIISIIGANFSFATNSENQEIINDLSVSSPLLLFMATVFVFPIVEEFVYRKLIMGHIFKNYMKTGLFVSSVLFGLAHFSLAGLRENFDPFNLLSYMVMGFFFGLVYLKTKRIEAAITAHLMNNLLATSIVLLVF